MTGLPLPPHGYAHSLTFWLLMRDLRSACVWIAGASLLANLLPHERCVARWPRVRRAYVWMVDVVAFCALNFRVCLPSLQQEFLGFRNRVRRRWHRGERSR